MRTTKKLVTALLSLFVIFSSVLSVSCTHAYTTVSVTVRVADAEDGFSGVIYENEAYRFELGTATVDGLLKALAADGRLTYSVSDGYAVINGYGFYDSPALTYSRGWVIRVNGVTPELGYGATIAEGDKIELEYLLFIHE